MAQRSNPNAEIARRAKAAMKSQKRPHADVAVQVGIAPRTFDRLLTGNADWKVIHVVALEDTLGIPLLTADA
jgi:hypothetical protein